MGQQTTGDLPIGQFLGALEERYDLPFDEGSQVFVPEETEDGYGRSFSQEYRTIAALHPRRGNTPYTRPFTKHDFRHAVGILLDPKDGADADFLFKQCHEHLSVFFSHPENLGQLGLLTRHFMSKYSDAEMLSGVGGETRARLKDIEKNLLEGDSSAEHADIANMLRILYNQSLFKFAESTGVANGDTSKFTQECCRLGEGNREPTFIGLPDKLKDALAKSDQGNAKSHYCLDPSSELAYKRGGWTLEDAQIAIANAKALGEKHGDEGVGRYALIMSLGDSFPQEMNSRAGRCYNAMMDIRKMAIESIKTGRPFHTKDLAAHISNHPGGETIGEDRGKEVNREGEERGGQNAAFSEQRAGQERELSSDKTQSGKKGAKGNKKRRRTAQEVAKVEERTGKRVPEELRDIMERKGVRANSYCATTDCFAHGKTYQGGRLTEWVNTASRSTSPDEATLVAAGAMTYGRRRVAVICRAGDQDKVLFFEKSKDNKITYEAMPIATVIERGGAVYRKGKIGFGRKDGKSWAMVGEIVRIPAGLQKRVGGEEKVSGHSPESGILGRILKRYFPHGKTNQPKTQARGI